MPKIHDLNLPDGVNKISLNLGGARIVIYKRLGQVVMRQPGNPALNPATEKQKQYRKKFALACKTAKVLSHNCNAYMRKYAKDHLMTINNLMTRCILKYAIVIDSNGEPQIDYSAIKYDSVCWKF